MFSSCDRVCDNKVWLMIGELFDENARFYINCVRSKVAKYVGCFGESSGICYFGENVVCN